MTVSVNRRDERSTEFSMAGLHHLVTEDRSFAISDRMDTNKYEEKRSLTREVSRVSSRDYSILKIKKNIFLLKNMIRGLKIIV